MSRPTLRDLVPTDLPRVLALNAASVRETSELDAVALARLVASSWSVTVAADAEHGSANAFLIVMDERAEYDSANYAWFKARHDRFVYVDRIVVAAEARGRGLAGLLYADLFDRARAAGYDLVGCEVNKQPPNPASDAFHAALGFRSAGEAVLANGKTVRYLTRQI